MSDLEPYEHPKGERDAHGRFEPFLVPRRLMPQIEDVSDFISWIEAQGIDVTYEDERPERLRPHQSIHWNDRGAEARINMHHPVIASWDRYLIDGHHCWKAHLDAGTLVPTYVIHAHWTRAIELAEAYPGVRHIEEEDAS